MRLPRVHWGLAARSFPGEAVSGDCHLVLPRHDGVLIAAADGLGHGEEAHRAADRAIRTATENPARTLPDIVTRCHEDLIGGRGVTMSLAFWSPERAILSWLGVGNVEGVMLSGGPDGRVVRQRLLNRNGVVGGSLPQLTIDMHPFPAGGLLLLATDGIGFGFDRPAEPDTDPQQVADQILAGYALGTDDALVLAVRLAAEFA